METIEQKLPTYKDLGFDDNLRRIVAERNKAINSNEFDAFFEIGDYQVQGYNIQDDVIDADHIMDLAVEARNVASGAIGTTKIADDAITTQKIIAGAVGANQIAANAVIAEKIAANAVIAEKIAANAIIAEKIGTNEIIANAANIKDGIITSAKIISLNADVINAGTITGRDLYAKGGSSGVDVHVSSAGVIRFRKDGNNKAYMACGSDGQLLLDADEWIALVADGSGDDILLSAGDDIFISADDDISLNAPDVTASGAMGIVGALVVGGNIRTNGVYRSSDGSSGTGFSHDIITSIFWSSGTLKARKRSYTFKGGICTSASSESEFTP